MTSQAQYAPITTLATIGNATPGLVTVPVTAINFTNIGAITLCFDYVYAGLHFVQGVPNPSLSGFEIGDLDQGNGKHRITMQWYGNGVTLPAGATIMTITFSYISGGTALEFYNNGPTCEYADGSGNVLIDVPTATYYKNGSVSPALVPNFIADNLAPPKNTTVNLTDLSTGGATSWAWSFNRPTVVFVNGTSASSQNPRVQFTDGGLYTVTLVVQNGFSANSMVKTDYIQAGISGLWTGNTSSDWNTISNWDNYFVPGGTTGVLIPAVAANWPVFNGNLTLGIHCASLTLSGTTSRMTITGVLTIP